MTAFERPTPPSPEQAKDMLFDAQIRCELDLDARALATRAVDAFIVYELACGHPYPDPNTIGFAMGVAILTIVLRDAELEPK